MTRRRGLLIGLVAVAALAVTATWLIAQRPSQQAVVDLSRSPQTVFVTNPFAVGETYTFGSTAVPSDVERPVRLTSIEVLHSHGVEVIGMGTLEPGRDAIGLVPGWPPPSPYVVDSPLDPDASWSSEVQALVGIRVVEPKSGLRGIALEWTDAVGRPGSRTFDFAVVTCAADATCDPLPSEDSGPLLRELGLMR